MKENKKNEVILIGLPNSGKSTLINTLTNKKNSIIGSEPNTTRDKISTVIEINNKQINGEIDKVLKLKAISEKILQTKKKMKE